MPTDTPLDIPRLRQLAKAAIAGRKEGGYQFLDLMNSFPEGPATVLALCDDNVRLRAAIMSVPEWGLSLRNEPAPRCRFCLCSQLDGHAADCVRKPT